MKTALIIDDSRLARAVLRKTLVGFGIEVDEVPSAEAAIEYLKVDSPDVIFLDHMMPGMDGFDTLSALKANPATATIPVLMYTAQEGQFYVSQARALGAVDVLPKSLAPADVERLLLSHHLIGGSGRTADDAERTGRDRHRPYYEGSEYYPSERRGVERIGGELTGSERAGRDWTSGEYGRYGERELAQRFKTMLDERTVLLMAEIRRELGRTQLAYETRLAEMLEESRPRFRRGSSAGIAMVASLATCGLLVGVGLPDFRQAEAPAQIVESKSPSAASEMSFTGGNVVPVTRLLPLPPEPASLPPQAESVALPLQAEPVSLKNLPASRYSVTRSYAYGSLPLDDTRAQELALLLGQLESEGFSGTVTLEIHEGRHCIGYSADGSAHLAAPDLAATSCDQISTSVFFGAASVQSPMFAELVDAVARQGRIRIDTVLHGVDRPLLEYPVLDPSVTAAHWNAVAGMNQRVSIRVDGSVAPGPSVAFATY